jgi:hypothetical protein
MILASVSAHGATGTWLDEILELGVPLVLFVGLWWWSTRKEKKKSKSTAVAPATPGTPTPKTDAKE